MDAERKPESKPRPRLLPVLGIVLSALCISWVVNQLHLVELSGELDTIAEGKLESYRAENPPATGTSLRLAADVVVSKPYIFWGAPAGKVSVFVEHRNAEGQEVIRGYEYFLSRSENGEWTQTESGRCTSDECTVEGKALLDAIGEQF